MTFTELLLLSITIVIIGFLLFRRQRIQAFLQKNVQKKTDVAETDALTLAFMKKYEALDSATLLDLLRTEQIQHPNERKAIETIIQNRQNPLI